MGRDMRDIIIVDNSPHSYAFHPFNAVAIDSWFDDTSDRQLDELLVFLDRLAAASDVSTILDATKGKQF
jgi:RNA polymerase II subunit A small phosphatase-like protein